MSDSVSGAKSPILVIGMHRSGTSLLTRMLEEQGLFVGWRLAANHEASFFNKHNAWILASAGGRWDSPKAIEHLLVDEAGCEMAISYLRSRLSSPAALEFLGPGRYLRYTSVFSISEPWGWKDPRTTITLPLWLRVFPDLRIIHLVRNGVDVATSLHRRQERGRSLARKNVSRYRHLHAMFPKRGWFGTSPRAASWDGAFGLWEEYLEFAARSTAGLGDRLLSIRFESLLADPVRELGRALDFCGLSRIEKSSLRLHTERAFAFGEDSDLEANWQRVRRSPWMVRYDYDSLPPHALSPNDA